MEEKLDHIVSKISNIESKLGNIDVTLAVQATQLTEHMKRSEENEKAVALIAEEIKPIQAHVAVVKAIGTAAMWAVGSGSVIFWIKKFFQ